MVLFGIHFLGNQSESQRQFSMFSLHVYVGNYDETPQTLFTCHLEYSQVLFVFVLFIKKKIPDIIIN